ncbi:MAG: PhnD/SsuA/transferrin family substrate-binding protein, partial [Betaproteobacteria bacterium]|nr:PhnD/SsuA/transferrin family substrate-binding protein [Betaproteobacteria bacterium]
NALAPDRCRRPARRETSAGSQARLSESASPRPNTTGRGLGRQPDRHGLINARRVIEALEAREIDAGPLDSYYHDLLMRNDREFAARVRVVATTEAAPMPPLVATMPLAARELERLRAALVATGSSAALAAQRETLLLTGFAVPDGSDYEVFDEILAASNEHAGIW